MKCKICGSSFARVIYILSPFRFEVFWDDVICNSCESWAKKTFSKSRVVK